jgi:chromosome segregation ATPase
MGLPERCCPSARTLAARSVPFMLVGLSGCTIVDMRNDVQDRQTRIDAKEQQLGELSATQTELSGESDRLKNDLQQRELNASELRARLDELIKLNEAAQVSSAQQLAQQQERRRQLQAVSQQAHALDQDKSLSDEEKQKELNALKEKTRALLKVLLTG